MNSTLITTATYAMKLIVCIFFVLAGCSPSDPQNKELAAITLAMGETRTAFNLSIARNDTTGMGSFWTDDIVVVTSRNNKTRGKKQYAEALYNEFHTKEALVYVRNPDVFEAFPRWGTAGEYGKWTGEWRVGTEEIRVTGTYYAKWKNINNQWLITAEVYTALTCEGDTYCNNIP
jgi:ketosteroid isomerase-like protein